MAYRYQLTPTQACETVEPLQPREHEMTTSNEPIHPRLQQIYDELNEAEEERSNTVDRCDEAPPSNRAMSVGIKRNGSGNRVRTLEEDRKQRSRSAKIKRASIDIKGHPLEVFKYDPVEGVIYSQAIQRIWSEENSCWENDHNHQYPNPDVFPRGGLAPYIRLVPVLFRQDKAKCALCISYHGKRFLAHRLAWELYYGEKAPNLRFADNNPSNIKLSNLVPVATATPKPYQARVSVKGKIVCLGSFATREQRDEAVMTFKALRKMGIV